MVDGAIGPSGQPAVSHVARAHRNTTVDVMRPALNTEGALVGVMSWRGSHARSETVKVCCRSNSSLFVDMIYV